MKSDDLREEIIIEIELIENVLREISDLRRDTSGRQPTVREKTAAASFLAQFYGGMENILKRICRFNGVPVPIGDTWHLDLFKMFCTPPHPALPELFDKSLETDISPFRQFRHVVYHSYGFQLDWERMKEGIEKVDDVFLRFKLTTTNYLDSMKSR